MCSGNAVDRHEESKLFISADNCGYYFPYEKVAEFAFYILFFKEMVREDKERVRSKIHMPFPSFCVSPHNQLCVRWEVNCFSKTRESWTTVKF